MKIIEELKQARYLNLGTFRRSGKRVDTPIWAAEIDGLFYAFSEGKAGKVKRLRNSSQATLAACNMRGGLLGEWHEADAYVVDDPQEIEAAYQALTRKYGWSVRLSNAFAKLTGRYQKRAVLRMVPKLEDTATA